MIRSTNKESYEVSCDECLRMVDFDGMFLQLINHFKDTGWIFRKTNGEWIHICPECLEE